MRLRCARSWWRVRAMRVPSARAGRYVAPAALQPAATPGRDGRHLTAPASKRHTRCHIRPGTTTTKRLNAGLRRRRIPPMIAFTTWPGQSGRVLWRRFAPWRNPVRSSAFANVGSRHGRATWNERKLSRSRRRPDGDRGTGARMVRTDPRRGSPRRAQLELDPGPARRPALPRLAHRRPAAQAASPRNPPEAARPETRRQPASRSGPRSGRGPCRPPPCRWPSAAPL